MSENKFAAIWSLLALSGYKNHQIKMTYVIGYFFLFRSHFRPSNKDQCAQFRPILQFTDNNLGVFWYFIKLFYSIVIFCFLSSPLRINCDGFKETSRNLNVFFIKVSKNERRTCLTNFIAVSIINGHKTKLNSNFVLALSLSY